MPDVLHAFLYDAEVFVQVGDPTIVKPIKCHLQAGQASGLVFVKKGLHKLRLDELRTDCRAVRGVYFAGIL